MATTAQRNTAVRSSQRGARAKAEENHTKRQNSPPRRSPSRPSFFSGNLTHEPEIRFTNNGKAVASFQLAVHPRSYNKQTGQWEDGETQFWNCVVWEQIAENFCETFVKGDRVMVHGYWKTREYEDDQGETKKVTEFNAQDAGASILFTFVQIPGGDEPVDRPVATEEELPF